jgi:hypothetical protein
MSRKKGRMDVELAMGVEKSERRWGEDVAE